MRPDAKQQLSEILAQAQDMTLATLRPDGWPQATTVGFVAEGCVLYFGCGAKSQKARNLARDPRVSLTVNLPYKTWSDIRGASMGGKASRVTDPGELLRITSLFLAKFPMIQDYMGAEPEEMAIFRVDPVVASVLDYREGFGAQEFVTLAAVAA